MTSFIDIKHGYWAYDDIMEAANTFLEDGTPLIEGLPYQSFETGKGYIYEEIKAAKGQVKFTLSKAISPSTANPLYVFIDGVQYGYKSTKIENGKTIVYLFTPPTQGSVISFMSLGVPKMERGRPILKTLPYYPHYKLKNSDTYTYYPANNFNEYLNVFGRTLKRVMLTEDDLNGNSGPQNPEYDQNLARKYIGSRTDLYIISPSGRIHLPWNFEGMTGKITYAYYVGKDIKKTTEEFKAWTGNSTDTTHEPYHNDRFFPSVWANRADVIIFLDKMRKLMYERLTDLDPPSPVLDHVETAYEGQKVFRLNGTYPSGDNEIKVYQMVGGSWVKKSVDTDYDEIGDHTILMKYPVEKGTKMRFYYEKTKSESIYDVGRDVRYYDSKNENLVSVNGTTDEWVPSVLSLEGEKLNDGTRLISGKVISNFFDPTSKTIPITDDYYRPITSNQSEVKNFFMPHTPISRSEGIVFLNRFRKWCLERFL